MRYFLYFSLFASPQIFLLEGKLLLVFSNQKMPVVNINVDEEVTTIEGTRLPLFLYTLYSSFDLESNALETFIGPRDEIAILRLALNQVFDDVDVSNVTNSL